MWRVNLVRSKDAQKQLAQMSLKKALNENLSLFNSFSIYMYGYAKLASF